MRRDPYEVIGVAPDAEDRDIKRAFRRLARELHPDVNSHDPGAEEKFKEAAEAYEILSDPERRAIYDRFGFEGLDSRGFASQAHGFGSFADIFDAFFGGDPFGGAFGGAGAGRVQGGDVAVEVEVSLEQAASGSSVDVSYELVDTCERCHGNGAEPGTPIDACERCGGVGRLRAVTRTAFGQLVREQACDVCGGEGKVPREPCAECGGRGRRAVRKTLGVDVPAGIADEQRIRLSGRGHAGERGGPPGDLYVLVRVTEDERFLRDGSDLVTVVDVPAPAAALGSRVTVPTLDGEEEVEVPAGTQPGTVVTLKGRGMPTLGRGRRGDQQVVLNVVIPRNLTRAPARAARRAARVAHGGQPPRAAARVAAVEGQAGTALIRLAIRAPAEHAEPVLAELLELAPAGLEQVDGEGFVEFALYGAPGELPALAEGDALVGGVRVRVRGQTVADDWAERWRAFHEPVLVGGRVWVRPPWAPPREDALDLVIDPGQAFGTGAHPTTRMSLELLLELPGRGALVDLGCGSGVLAIAAAKLGLRPRGRLRPRPGGDRGNARERARERRRAAARRAARPARARRADRAHRDRQPRAPAAPARGRAGSRAARDVDRLRAARG